MADEPSTPGAKYCPRSDGSFQPEAPKCCAGGENVGGSTLFTWYAEYSYVCASFRSCWIASARAASIRCCAAVASDWAVCASLRASGSLRAPGSCVAASVFRALARSALACVVSDVAGIAALASATAWATVDSQREATSAYWPRRSVAAAL